MQAHPAPNIFTALVSVLVNRGVLLSYQQRMADAYGGRIAQAEAEGRAPPGLAGAFAESARQRALVRRTHASRQLSAVCSRALVRGTEAAHEALLRASPALRQRPTRGWQATAAMTPADLEGTPSDFLCGVSLGLFLGVIMLFLVPPAPRFFREKQACEAGAPCPQPAAPRWRVFASRDRIQELKA